MKSKQVVALLLAAPLIASSVSIIGSADTINFEVGRKNVLTNSAANWTVSNGDASQLAATDTEGGVQIGNLHAYSAEMINNDKIVLDGASFTFQNVGDCTSTNAATGFYFSQSTSPAWSTPTFMIWHGLFGQSRLVVGANHDYNAAGVTQVSPSNDATTGFGLASNMVMNCLTNDGFNVAFEHISFSWWKITLTEIFDSSFWNTNANYSKPEGASFATVTTYLKNSEMPVDSDGAAYFHVASAGSGGTVSVTSLVNGTFKEVPEDDATADEIAACKAKINAIDASEYPSSLAEQIGTIKTNALTAIETATKPSALQKIIDDANAAIKAAYATYAGYDSELTENDPTANFAPSWGAPAIGKRYDDKGAVTLSLNTNFGYRGQFIRQYDYSNVAMTINLSAIAVNSVVFVNIASEADAFVDSAAKFYHIEFYKYSDTNYIAVFGNNGTAHNVSYGDWGTESSGDYAGRIIVTNSGTMKISMTTDFTTNKSTLAVNDVSLEFDSSVINKGVTPTEGANAYVQMGGMNKAEPQRVLVEKIEDTASKAYAENLSGTVSALKTAIGAAKDTLLATVPEAGLDDTSYPAYKAAYDEASETITGLGGLTTYDYAYYDIKPIADAAMEAVAAPLLTYAASVATAKETAKTEINAYDEAAYREAEKATLATAKEKAIAAIDAAETLADVATALANGKTAIGAIKTNAQYEAEELAAAKTAAIAELEGYVKLTDYREAEKTTINGYIADGKTAINAATTTDAIAAALTAAKTKIDAVKTDKALTAEELAAAKTSAITELQSYVKLADYRDAEKTKVQGYMDDGETDINFATTVSEVNTILADYKSKIDAVKTNAQYEAEELAAAKTAAIAELEGYIADTTKYSDANKTKITEAIEAGKTAINAATTKAAVATALADAKTALDAIPTGTTSNGCGGSIVGTSIAVSALALAVGGVFAIRRGKKKED